MSVVRSYNLSNGLAVADAPASIVRVLTVVSAQAGGGSGAVDSVNGETGVVVLSASDVSAQPVDSDLTAIAALTTTSFGRSLLTAADAAAARVLTGAGTSSLALGTSSSTAKAGDYQPTAANISDSTSIGRSVLTAADAAAVRTAIGAGTSSFDGAYASLTGKPTLGTAAASATTDFDAAGAAASAQAASQPLDSDLTAIAALTTTSFGRSLLTAADAAGARTTLALGTAATVDTGTSSGNIPLLSTGGRLPIARIASGTPDGTKFVRDDGTLVTPGGGGTVTSVTAGDSTITVGGTSSDPTIAVNAIAESKVTNLTTDLAAKAPLASPTFTGTPAAPTASAATNTTQVATTAFVQGEITAKAPLASPTFTGNPLAPTPSAGDNDTSIATTAFVTAALTKQAEVFVFALGDETTAITTGTAKVTWRCPFAFTVTAVRASLTTASSSGIPTVDINEAGTTILSTKLTIDASELTSVTAATAAVISDTSLADDAEITFDIDVAGTGAKGLKVAIFGTRT